MSIFKDFSSAFSAMYDSTVAITGTRPNGATVRGSFAACVFPVAFDDPLADTDSASDRRRLSVTIPRVGDRAWNLTTPPQIGDTIEIDGSSYSVAKVSISCGDDYELEVREN